MLICKLIRKPKLLLFNNIKKNKNNNNTNVLKSLVRDLVEVVIIWENWTNFFSWRVRFRSLKFAQKIIYD